MNRQTYRQMDVPINKQIDRQKNTWKYKYMDRHKQIMDRQTYRQMDGPINKMIDGQKNT